MARSELALTALAGAMVGLAMAVAAVLAERRPSAGAAGVSAGLVAGVGADHGARPRRCHGGPRHGALAPWPARACAAALTAPTQPGSGLSTAIVSQRPFRQYGQMLASIPATRLRKAAASSQAWGLAAGMASAWRAAGS